MNTTLKPAPAGSVSTGTLRTVDLMQAFNSTLDYLLRQNADYFNLSVNSGQRFCLEQVLQDSRAWLAQPGNEVDECEILDELFDALELFAPEGCYFGSHPGDGADFGFWPTEQND